MVRACRDDPDLKAPPLPVPGITLFAAIEFGTERYRYPTNLPKVAATGGPQCHTLPNVPMDVAPPYVVADVGANPGAYGNQQLLINSDALKHCCLGPSPGRRETPRRSGNPDDERTRNHHQVRGLRDCDGATDCVLVLHFQPVPNRLDQRVFRSLQRRVAPQGRTDRTGRRHPGGHRQRASLCATTRRCW